MDEKLRESHNELKRSVSNMDSNINMPLETYVNSTYKTFKEAERTYYNSKNKLMVVIYILVIFIIICR